MRGPRVPHGCVTPALRNKRCGHMHATQGLCSGVHWVWVVRNATNGIITILFLADDEQ